MESDITGGMILMRKVLVLSLGTDYIVCNQSISGADSTGTLANEPFDSGHKGSSWRAARQALGSHLTLHERFRRAAQGTTS